MQPADNRTTLVVPTDFVPPTEDLRCNVTAFRFTNSSGVSPTVGRAIWPSERLRTSDRGDLLENIKQSFNVTVLLKKFQK